MASIQTPIQSPVPPLPLILSLNGFDSDPNPVPGPSLAFCCSDDRCCPAICAAVVQFGCGIPQGRVAGGGHGLLKVSLGLAMPYPSTSCGWTTPETDSRPFRGWPALRAGHLRPFATPLDTSRCAPMIAAAVEPGINSEVDVLWIPGTNFQCGPCHCQADHVNSN
jgi:hypothetical protein